MSTGDSRVIRVEDLSDPRVDDYRNVKDADLVKSRGVFIVESPKTVDCFVRRSPHPVRSLLLSEKHSELADALLDVLPPKVPLYIAPQALMEEIVGFKIHRGALAVGERWMAPPVESLLGDAQRVLVGEGVSNADNVGSMFRNAAAFGVDAVLLDAGSADPLYRKSIRVSIGSALTVPWARVESGVDAVERLSSAGFLTLALTPNEKAIPLDEISTQLQSLDERIAVVVGSEGDGLCAETLARADWRVSIPIAEQVDSINVAAATAVALYALRVRGHSVF